MNPKERATKTAAPETQSKSTEKEREIQENLLQNTANSVANTIEEFAPTPPQYLGDEWELRVDEEITHPAYTLRIGEIGTLPRGDIQAIKAKSKSGKTYAASIFAAVALGATFGELTPVEKNARVLLFDTEQNRANALRVLRRIYRLAGWDEKTQNDRLHVYSLRKMEMNARRAFITGKTELIAPAVVIIDGVADLMQDFNNVTESTAAIDWLMKLSAENNCAVVCVLHENKSKDDAGMKGHLGTMLLQKASDVFQCSRTNGIFTTAATDSRNVPTPDFSFVIDSYGLPVPHAATTPQDATRERIKATLSKIGESGGLFSYADLCRRYALETACSDATAKRHIGMAKREGFLIVGNDQKYKVVSSGII